MPQLVWNPNRRAFELSNEEDAGSMPPAPYHEQPQQDYGIADQPQPPRYTNAPGSMDMSTPDPMEKVMQQMRDQHEVNKRVEGERQAQAEKDAPDKARSQLALAEALGQFKYTSGAQIRAGVHEEAPAPKYTALRSLMDTSNQPITQEESDFYRSQGINIPAGIPRSSVNRVMPSLSSYATRSKLQETGHQNAMDRQEIGYGNAISKMGMARENSLERQAQGRENSMALQSSGNQNALDRQEIGRQNALEMQGLRDENATTRAEYNQGQQNQRADAREVRLKEQFQTTQGNREEGRLDTVVKRFRSDLMKVREMSVSATKAQEQLETGNPEIQKQALVTLLRASGDTHLSNTDVNRAYMPFGGPQRLEAMYDRIVNGQFDQKIIDAGIQTAKMLKEIAGRTEKDYAETYGQQFGGRFGQSSEDIKNTLVPPAPSPGKIKVRNRATGQTGSISPEFFDPAKYEKL